MGRARARAWGHALDTHFPHIPLDALPIHPPLLMPELRGNAPGPVKRMGGINLVDPMFQGNFLGIRPDGPVIQAGAIKTQQIGLDGQRQPPGVLVDESQTLSATEGRGQIFF